MEKGYFTISSLPRGDIATLTVAAKDVWDALRRGEELPTIQTYAEIGCPILHTVHGSGIFEGANLIWLDSKHAVTRISHIKLGA